MVRPRDNAHRFVEERLGLEIGRYIGGLQTADEQVQFTDPQSRQQTLQIAFFDQNRRFRRMRLQQIEGARQQVGNRYHHCADGCPAGNAAGDRGDLVTGPPEIRQHRASKAYDGRAEGGRLVEAPNGVGAPKGSSAATEQRLRDAFKEAVASAEFAAASIKIGAPVGSVMKGGSTPLQAVYEYAEAIDRDGFVFMDSPDDDPVATTGQIASGANLICFTTGRGSMFGRKPTPTIKLASNTPMYHRLEDDMDINCGLVLDGETNIEQMGQRIFERMLAVASGEKTKSELLGLGDHEFVPWHPGIVS